MAEKTGEFLEKRTKTKEIYCYHNNNMKETSKEIFLTQDKIIHYPKRYNYDFQNKYNYIKRIVFIGFKNKLPVGVYKSASKGYGFTRITFQFGEFLDKELKLEEVVIEKNGNPKIDKKTKSIVINEEIIAEINKSLSWIIKKQKDEKLSFLLEILKPIFPKEIELPEKQYRPNELALTISNWNNSVDEFSIVDKKALKELFQKLALKKDFLDFNSISETKLVLESQYLNSCLLEYSKLLKQPKDTHKLEKQWQIFFKEKNWILSYIFSQPVILYKDEAYVGGKNINNENGKITDFLMKNKLTNNISFLEIKTHKSKILSDKPFRGEDVFSISDVFSGCINQVLNQRDNFQKEYYTFLAKAKKEIKSFNPRCIVLIGCLSDMTENQKNCFEIFRNNSKDVEIITYDELEQKIRMFIDLLQK